MKGKLWVFQAHFSNSQENRLEKSENAHSNMTWAGIQESTVISDLNKEIIIIHVMF